MLTRQQHILQINTVGVGATTSTQVATFPWPPRSRSHLDITDTLAPAVNVFFLIFGFFFISEGSTVFKYSLYFIHYSNKSPRLAKSVKHKAAIV